MLSKHLIHIEKTPIESSKKWFLALLVILSALASWHYLPATVGIQKLVVWYLVLLSPFILDFFLTRSKLPDVFGSFVFAVTQALALSSCIWLFGFSRGTIFYFDLALFVFFAFAAVFVFSRHFIHYLLFLLILNVHILFYLTKSSISLSIIDYSIITLLDIALLYFAYDISSRLIDAEKRIEEGKIRQKFLLEAASNAEASSQAKSRFVVDMNNELKTRLKVIMNYAQMIIMSNLNNVQGKRAKALVQSSKLLMRLVDQLQDVNDIELGNIELKMQEIRLVDLVSKAVNLVLPFSIQKNMPIDEQYDGIENVMVYVDPARLNQVLLNILSNAIKFNRPRGKISVTGKFSADNRVRIEIKDSGKGIPEDKVAYIFEAFTRIDDNQSKKGSGLGLHVAKAFTEAMGGDISVTSVPGYGSIFAIELEVSDVSGQPVEHINKAVAVNQNILVVDDSKVKRIVLTRQIHNIGDYRITQASSGAEALKSLAEKQYQLVISDFLMPEMDGAQLCEQIRKNQSKELLPILVITNDTTDSTRERCLQAGADEVLIHPVDTQKLKVLIAHYINEKALNQIRQDRQNQGSILYQQIKKNLLDTFGDNKEAMEKLFSSYIKTLKEECQKLQVAQKGKSIKGLKQAIAKIKWASKSIGAEQLIKLCAKLERVGDEADWNQLKKPIAYIIKYQKVLELEHKATAGNFSIPVPDFENLAFLSKMSVIMIDDDFFLLNYVKQVLDNFGVHDIAIFTEAEEALDAIKQQNYDLILSDLNMPTMDGIEFFRRLADMNYEKRIILMSGLSAEVRESAAKLSRSFGLNIVGTIGKPIQSEELKELLYLSDPDYEKNKKENALVVYGQKELIEAIESNEFIPFYQAKVDVEKKQIVGFEALVRWKKSRKIVLPVDFIDQINQYGLSKMMTEKVIKQVLKDLRSWRKTGYSFKVSINITVELLEDNGFIENLINDVKESNLPKGSIVIELTETALFEDYLGALESATRLRMAGFELSIDDFGTGSATFEQLNKIPFTELKIDKSFVTNAYADQSKQTILESSLEVAKKLKLKTVAEGIETQQDYDLLFFLGCDYLQGYYFSAPLDKKKTDAWIKRWQKKNLN